MKYLKIKLTFLGYLYNDPIVSKAVKKQVPFLHLDPKSKAAISLKHIVSRLEGIDFKEGGGGVRKFVMKLVGAQ